MWCKGSNFTGEMCDVMGGEVVKGEGEEKERLIIDITKRIISHQNIN